MQPVARAAALREGHCSQLLPLVVCKDQRAKYVLEALDDALGELLDAFGGRRSNIVSVDARGYQHGCERQSMELDTDLIAECSGMTARPKQARRSAAQMPVSKASGTHHSALVLRR